MTNKAQLLTAIFNEIKECHICQQTSLGIAVPGEGNPNADIVFVGEAPGRRQ